MARQTEAMEMQQQLVLLTKLSKVACFCVDKLDSNVTSPFTDSEKSSLSTCVERYFDSEQFLMERLQVKAKQMMEQSAKSAH